jgi:hypothetical protein
MSDELLSEFRRVGVETGAIGTPPPSPHPDSAFTATFQIDQDLALRILRGLPDGAGWSAFKQALFDTLGRSSSKNSGDLKEPPIRIRKPWWRFW